MDRIKHRENIQMIVAVLTLGVASTGIALFAPEAGYPLVTLLSEHAVNLGILYAIIIGFFMSITLKRKYALDEYISLELNKIRRLYHLGLHIARIDPKLSGWFEQLRDSINEYQIFFRKEHFSKYESSGPIFRKVTYTVYELPQVSGDYNKELYYSMLETAASATEAREYIKEKRGESVTLYQWIVLVVVTLTFNIFIAMATEAALAPRLVTSVVIFNVLLTLAMLYKYDNSYGRQNMNVNHLYATNLKLAEDDKQE